MVLSKSTKYLILLGINELDSELGEHQEASAPGRTRTCGTQIRNLVLYPPELRGHINDINSLADRLVGRIRRCDSFETFLPRSQDI